MHNSELLEELDSEMTKTRKMLASVPSESFAWRPHTKSKTLGELANHLAAMPALVAAVVSGQAKRSPDITSTAALLEAFDRNWALGREAIAKCGAGHVDAFIPALKMTRIGVLRNRVISHMIHHRGQMSVYLRLLGSPVPGMYGPSGDETEQNQQ